MTGTHTGTTQGTPSGRLRDSRAPSPSHSPSPSLKTVQHAEGVDLWEEPEKGPDGWDKPDAPRLHEEPDGARHRPGVFSNEEFRRLCVLVRAELQAQPTLDGADLMEQLKTACAARHLRYDGAVLGRVLDVVQPRKQLVARHAEPPRVHWRDRCAHTPRCTTPTQCELRAAREVR
jgi:hypothetical protein